MGRRPKLTDAQRAKARRRRAQRSPNSRVATTQERARFPGSRLADLERKIVLKPLRGSTRTENIRLPIPDLCRRTGMEQANGLASEPCEQRFAQSVEQIPFFETRSSQSDHDDGAATHQGIATSPGLSQESPIKVNIGVPIIAMLIERRPFRASKEPKAEPLVFSIVCGIEIWRRRDDKLNGCPQFRETAAGTACVTQQYLPTQGRFLVRKAECHDPPKDIEG